MFDYSSNYCQQLIERRITKYIYLSFKVVSQLKMYRKIILMIGTNSNSFNLAILNTIHPMFIFHKYEARCRTLLFEPVLIFILKIVTLLS